MFMNRPTDAPHDNRQDWHNIQALLPYLWEYKGRVLLTLLVLLLSKFAHVATPFILKYLVDGLEMARNQPEQVVGGMLLVLVLAYGLAKLLATLFNELRDVIFAKVRYRAMRRLSSRVLAHLHDLSLRFHLERKTGALSRDLERGTRSLSSILNYLIFNIIPTAVEFILIAAILLSQYDWYFMAITFVTVIVYVSFTLLVSNWRMHHRFEMNRLESQANNRAIDSLINYETVKYFGNEKLEHQVYDDTLAEWEKAAIDSQTSMSWLNFGQGAVIALGVAAIMYFATEQVLKGQMSLGDLVLVNTFLLQLFMPLNFLGVIYRAIKYALADMDLLMKTLEQAPEIQDPKIAQPFKAQQVEVHFDKVSFYYHDRPILEEIEFKITAGQKVAVVGASGAGKSTLARLLYRFYDVQTGAVRLNGQDIRELSQKDLRAAIGIVPQDTVLFNDSLYHNIAYAKPDATMDEVEQVTKLADLHHFIAKLKQGYDTVVGERGLKLSGGEKQRVAIARAILKNPPLLIFDEATSSLDSKSEQMIQQALQKLAKNHTTLVIAHRLSTITDADTILVMQQGRIVEQGTHQALLAKAGLYAQMWALQQEDVDHEAQ